MHYLLKQNSIQTPSKVPESLKDVSRAGKSGDQSGVEKLAIIHSHHSSLRTIPDAPTSSAEADIVGTSFPYSASLVPNQDSSMATSKKHFFREGFRHSFDLILFS